MAFIPILLILIYLLAQREPLDTFVFLAAFVARFLFLIFWMEMHKTAPNLDLEHLMFPDEFYYTEWSPEDPSPAFHGYGYVIYLLRKVFSIWELKLINITIGAFTIYRITKEFNLIRKRDLYLYTMNLILLQHLFYSIFILRDVIFCWIIAEIFFCYKDYFYTRQIKSIRVIALLSIAVFLRRVPMVILGLPLVYIYARRRFAYCLVLIVLVLLLIVRLRSSGITIMFTPQEKEYVHFEFNSLQAVKIYTSNYLFQVLTFTFNRALNPLYQKDWVNRYFSLEFYATIFLLIITIRRYVRTAYIMRHRLRKSIGLVTAFKILRRRNRYIFVLTITPLIYFFGALLLHYNPRYNLQPQFYLVLLLLFLVKTISLQNNSAVIDK